MKSKGHLYEWDWGIEVHALYALGTMKAFQKTKKNYLQRNKIKNPALHAAGFVCSTFFFVISREI